MRAFIFATVLSAACVPMGPPVYLPRPVETTPPAPSESEEHDADERSLSTSRTRVLVNGDVVRDDDQRASDDHADGYTRQMKASERERHDRASDDHADGYTRQQSEAVEREQSDRASDDHAEGYTRQMNRR